MSKKPTRNGDNKATLAEPPAGLCAVALEVWRRTIDDFGIGDAHGLAILRTAALVLDRSGLAQEALDRDGTVTTDRFGQVCEHPGVRTARDARAGFLRALRELALTEDAPDPRPPRLKGR